MQTADDVFRNELDNRGITYSITLEGLYEVEIHGRPLTVSLENVRRNYDRDADAAAIVQFVESLGDDSAAAPSWNDVRPYVRYSLEPTDYEHGFDDFVFTAINDGLNQVFVYSSVDGSRITWVNKSSLDQWGVTREQVFQQAEENMAAILAEAKFEVEDVNGNKLGMLSTEETPFKASLILSPAFRDLVSPTLGWPVLVVVPCRDFVYVVPNDGRELLGRLSRVVIKEYRNSGHPITKDVLELSDSGIAVVGTYSEPE